MGITKDKFILYFLLVLAGLYFNYYSSDPSPEYKGSTQSRISKCNETCKTETFKAKGKFLRLNFSAKKKVFLNLIQKNQSVNPSSNESRIIKPVRIFKGGNSNTLEYRGLKHGEDYYLEISKSVELKPKLTFYDSEYKRSDLNLIELTIIAILLGLFVFRFKFNLFNLFLIALLFQLRLDTYFYFDEWSVNNLFSIKDFDLLRHRHNEHYLPFFFLFYFLETKLFSLNYSFYLIISCFVHALNSLFVKKILFIVAKEKEKTNKIPSILSALFLINSLHSEALHWAFEQSLLICSTLMLVSIFYFLKYLKNESSENQVYSTYKYYFLCVIPAFICPFVFGNGFSLILLLASFSILVTKKYLQKLKVLLPISFWYLFSLTFYFGKSSGLGFSISKILIYLFHATLYGIVLRGVGFTNSLEKNLANEFIAKQYFLNYLIPTILGLLICIFLYIYSRKKQQTKVFLVGFLILISSVILPAVSRWSFGIEQGLSLRYSYFGVFGLSLMFLPLIKKTKLFFVITCFYLFLNLNLISKYRYFSNYGVKHETYVKQLVEWKCENNKIAPKYPSTIVPGGGHDFIFNSIKFIDSNICKEGL